MTREVVPMSHLRVAGPSAELVALGVGSCVAVVLHDAGAVLGGMGHIVLPGTAPAYRVVPPGKYAEPAVSTLVALLREAGASRERLTARLAGGASMFAPAGDALSVGERNVRSVREALAVCGIPISGEWVGGAFGRSVFFEVRTGRVRATSFEYGSRFL
jgi:chemotaxis protein CheD